MSGAFFIYVKYVEGIKKEAAFPTLEASGFSLYPILLWQSRFIHFLPLFPSPACEFGFFVFTCVSDFARLLVYLSHAFLPSCCHSVSSSQWAAVQSFPFLLFLSFLCVFTFSVSFALSFAISAVLGSKCCTIRCWDPDLWDATKGTEPLWWEHSPARCDVFRSFCYCLLPSMWEVVPGNKHLSFSGGCLQSAVKINVIVEPEKKKRFQTRTFKTQEKQNRFYLLHRTTNITNPPKKHVNTHHVWTRS